MRYTLRVSGPSTDNEEILVQRSLTVQELTVALMILQDGDSAVVDVSEESPDEGAELCDGTPRRCSRHTTDTTMCRQA